MKIKLLLSVAIWCLISVGTARAQVVIVNASVKVSSISSSDLKDLYNGTSKSFSDGSHAIPVTLKGGTVHEAFLKNHLGKTSGAFQATWRQIVFSGQGTAPRAFDTESALIEYVASTPGAIGYIGNPTNREKVKVISVR